MLRHIIPKKIQWAIFPISGFMFGWYLDIKETERMVFFRDKSALYGREMGPDEKPTWP